MKGRLRLQRALQSALNRKENVTDTIPGLLGTTINGKQRVKVSNRKGFVYVRLHGNLSETIKAYNDQVLQIYGMPVLVKRVHGKGYHYYVTGKDIGRYPNWGGNNAQAQYAQHGNQHSFGIGAGGSDVVWVFKKQFMPLLLYPYSGTAVRVTDDWYQWGDEYKHFTGSVVEIGAAKPVILGDSRFVTLYLDGNTNTVKGATGTLFASTPFPADVSPYINVPTPSEGIPLSAVLLTSDTTNIAWNNIYDDIRPIFGVGGSGDSVYSSGTIVTNGQSLYLTDITVYPEEFPTPSTNYNNEMRLSNNDAMGKLPSATTDIQIAQTGTTAFSFVSEDNEIAYINSGDWSVDLYLDLSEGLWVGSPTPYFNAQLWKKSSAGAWSVLSTTPYVYAGGGVTQRLSLIGTLTGTVIVESSSQIALTIGAHHSGSYAEISYVSLWVNRPSASKLNLPAVPVYGGGHILEDEGTTITQRGYANFIGAGVHAYDDGNKTIISIPGTTVFESGAFKLSGSSVSFDAGLHVDVTGSVAYIQSTNPTISDLDAHEPFIVIAHRGDINNTDGYPEDTIAAFLSAYWRGAHRSEIDVRQSADGTWYAIHDDTVNRTTNGTGNVVDKTDAQLDALWIDGGYGYNASRHSGTYHPPTLQAVITALDPLDTTLQIENKTASNSRSIAELLVANNWQHRALIQVQSQAEAQEVNAVSPTIKVISHSSTVWSETDTISAATGTYTAAQIAAYAPKQVIIYDSIDNYTGSNQATLIRDAWNIGARGFNTWDLNVAFYEYQKFRYLDDHIADPNAHPGLVGGGGSSITIYEGGAQKATGTTGIDFHNGFGVIVSGTVAYITNSIVSGTSTYVRAGAPVALTAITGAYWAVPDYVYATGTLSLFINGVAQSPVADFTEQYPASGTYQLTDVHPTGTIFTAIWGVPVINLINSPPYDARFVMGEVNAGVPNGIVKDYLYDNYDRDAYPSSPTSWDDDFDSTSINAKWTKVNNPAGTNAFSTSKYPGYLWVGLLESPATLGTFQGYPRMSQVAPTGIDATGTFDFVAKASLATTGEGMEAAEWAEVGIYLGSSGTFEFVSSFIEANDGISVNQAFRCGGGMNGVTGALTSMTTLNRWQAVDPADFIYLKLSKMTSGAYTSANTYTAYFSKNGMIWQEVGTQSKTFTGMPNEVGLLFRRPKLQSGTAYAEALVDFFRKV